MCLPQSELYRLEVLFISRSLVDGMLSYLKALFKLVVFAEDEKTILLVEGDI
jgi:hypothetical protein